MESYDVRDGLQGRGTCHIVLDHTAQISISFEGAKRQQEHGEVALKITAREIGPLSEPCEGLMHVRTIHEHIIEDGEAKSKSIEVSP